MNSVRKLFLIVRIRTLSFFRKDAMDLRIKLFRMRGCAVGVNCRIFSELGGSEPFLITVGNDVTISVNVTLLTHDNSIIKASKKEFTDLFGSIVIGDNCFVGANSIIMPGVTLSEGTIVAAGSVVTKSMLKPGMIIGGNPAKVICSVAEYYKKNMKYGFNCAGLDRAERKRCILNNKEKLVRKKELT